MKTTVTQAPQQVVTSVLGGLNLRDIARGLIMTVIGAVVTTIYSATTSDGGFAAIDWEVVLLVGFNTGLNYLIMNVLTPAKVVITNPTKETVKAVKDIKKNSSEVKVTISGTPPPTAQEVLDDRSNID